LDLRQLRCFVAIAEAGSLSKASAYLGVAQPAISLTLASLERELGTQLFDRGNRGVALTGSGSLLLKHASNILQNVNEAILGLQAPLDITGVVRIGLPGTASEIMGSLIVRRIIATYPGIAISIIEDSVKELRRMLLQGQIDLAVLVNESHQASLELHPIVIEHYCLVGHARFANKSKSIDWKGISQLPLLLPPPGTFLRKLVDTSAAANGIRLAPIAEMSSTHLLKDAVRAELGFTILSNSSIYVAVDAKSFWNRRIIDPEVRASLVLASSKVRAASRAQQAVKQMLLNLGRELVSDGRWRA
jgi:LysR family nitrogen assimilation transcriptional regulator